METSDLIKAMATDANRSPMPLGRAWRIALGGALVLAAAAFFTMLGPRQDAMAAMGTMRFPFKFVATLTLAASAYMVLRQLSRPAGKTRPGMIWLFVAPALLFVAVCLELFAIPPSAWMTQLMGHNNMLCLTFIPLMGIAPLALFLATLRHGASTRPTLAGLVAGILAGSVAASFYAAHCPDDSPLFVAVWYTLAIAVLALAGALVGPRVARW